MENTTQQNFASGLQQLERNQEDFEKVLRQPPAPPTYAQSMAPAPAPMPMPMPIVSTNNVIVTAPQSPQVIVQHTEPRPDNCAALCFSCFVLWFCCCPLGLAAFIVAVMATDQQTAADVRRQLSISNGLSCAGIVCGIVISIIIAIMNIAGA